MPSALGRRAVALLPVNGRTLGLALGLLGVPGVPGVLGVPVVPGVRGIFSPRTWVTGVLTVLVSFVGFVSPGVLTVPVLVSVPVAAPRTVVKTLIVPTVCPAGIESP